MANNFFDKIRWGLEDFFKSYTGLGSKNQVPSSNSSAQREVAPQTTPSFSLKGNKRATSRANEHEFYVKIFWDRGFWKLLIFDLKHGVGKIRPLGLRRW